jgi:uncharacterized membrane protein
MFDDLAATRPGRAILAGLALLVVAVLAGVALLWPAGTPGLGPAAPDPELAEVRAVDDVGCELTQRGRCQRISAELLTGPDDGRRTVLTLPGTDFAPEVERGDRIRVQRNQVPEGGQGAAEAYAFSDFERRMPLAALAVLFAVLVVALARWKGLRSLLGLAASLAIVTQFMVPAILAGSSPLAVALVGALAVMLVTIGLAHGTGVTSVAAAAGSTLSLLVTTLLAALFAGAAHITGFSSEEATLLLGGQAGTAGLSLSGLVLAGIVVGALGVLDDVTVSQASTVLALRRADPAQSLRRLTAAALGVGRDHLSATVNTLVLAYVGAALPVLLIFESTGTSFGDAVGRETVAAEIVAMLVGSIGLVLAVPLTTFIAAWLSQHLTAEALEHSGHGHAH